jgi:hypothetical protein
VIRSWWHFVREFIFAAAMLAGGFFLLSTAKGFAVYGALLTLGGLALIGLSIFVRNRISWSLTSDRLIENHDLFTKAKREMELTDIRSIDVSRSVRQRLCSVGTVAVVSGATAQFMILMTDIRNPEEVAHIIRQARLKRLG